VALTWRSAAKRPKSFDTSSTVATADMALAV
jgi:hypothetical protein